MPMVILSSTRHLCVRGRGPRGDLDIWLAGPEGKLEKAVAEPQAHENCGRSVFRGWRVSNAGQAPEAFHSLSYRASSPCRFSLSPSLIPRTFGARVL